MTRAATCASCSRYPREALETDGAGTCAIFEKPVTHDYPACVLYEPAGDKPQRYELVLRLRGVKREAATDESGETRR